MLRKLACKGSNIEWRDGRYLACAAVSFFFIFVASCLFTDGGTAAFLALVLVEPLASLIMIAMHSLFK